MSAKRIGRISSEKNAAGVQALKPHIRTPKAAVRHFRDWVRDHDGYHVWRAHCDGVGYMTGYMVGNQSFVFAEYCNAEGHIGSSVLIPLKMPGGQDAVLQELSKICGLQRRLFWE
ncbi:MAG: hypothetical protein AAF589_06735 [Planctomycetota bacterium]